MLSDIPSDLGHLHTPPTAPAPASPPAVSSYGQILKSSSLIGGSAGISAVISMARAKAGAIFLGLEGVGLLGLYYSLFSMLGTISGMGINSSGVRQVAAAVGSNDTETIGRTIRILRRICWVTGIGGWILAAALSWPLSQWVFGNHDHAVAIGLIGCVLLFGAISGGQIALVQGMRRIADLAKFNVVSSVLTTGIAILSYWQLGLRGIVPAMIFGGALTLVNSWWFARRVSVPDSQEIGFVEALRGSRDLLALGSAFMWSGALLTTSTLVKSSMVVSMLGLAAAGYYNAAWSITVMFSSLILGAMGADYYPRLASVSNDPKAMRRMVNEQTEVCILLTLPVLIGILTFSPIAIRVFYSVEFLPAANLLQWFVLGICGRVIAWPLSYIILAKSASKLYATAETLSIVFHLTLAIILLHVIGLPGIPIAFFIHHIFYTIAMLFVSNCLIKHIWSKDVVILIIVSGAIIGSSFLIRQSLPDLQAATLGSCLLVLSGIHSLRGLTLRLGSAHRLVKTARKIPLFKFLLPTDTKKSTIFNNL